jgi:hypothetical protein
MRTSVVIGVGFVVLAIFLLVGRSLGGGSVTAAARAALWFIPAWLVAATVNLWIGVRHGYSVAEELPIGLAVFGAPAAVALLFWWRFSRSKPGP